jgi:hypothetical protein
MESDFIAALLTGVSEKESTRWILAAMFRGGLIRCAR